MEPVPTYKPDMSGASPDEVVPGLGDGSSHSFFDAVGHKEPNEYEAIQLSAVKEMMRDMDRRARRVGIFSAVIAIAVAAVLVDLSLDSFLIVVATAASGAVVGLVTTRLVGWNAQRHQPAA
ncbi:MAG: hypothetical protein E6J90_47485 [Deltaproteobacteria bacterium]|nr:MAG: hypothetical protein E6J90_47485 [Deltaproteobacteria bacterium]TMQ11663.1 MAG: hypothetical protein E6J91_22250 [Deltaproteobacteria bacterium]